jgi:hypothetical protein
MCVCVRKEMPLPSDLRVIDIVPGYYKKLARSRKLLAREYKSTLLLRSDDDSFGGMDSDAKLCLVHSLRNLGVPVVAPIAGPLWALGDGNSMLQSFGKRLQHVTSSMLECGHYVLWLPQSSGCGHFIALIITPSNVVVHDGNTTAVFSSAAEASFPTDLVMYKLVLTASTSSSVLTESQLASIENNREAALET